MPESKITKPTKDILRLWVPREIFDDEPPYLATSVKGYGCRTCPNTLPSTTKESYLLEGCKDCTPRMRGHILEAAWRRHTSPKLLRSHQMVREKDWAIWIANPYQPVIEPDYLLWHNSDTNVSLADFCNWVPPQKAPKDAPWEYLNSWSGLSYQQWIQRPEELRHHLKTDVKREIYLGETGRPLKPGELITLAGGKPATFERGIKPIEILCRGDIA